MPSVYVRHSLMAATLEQSYVVVRPQWHTNEPIGALATAVTVRSPLADRPVARNCLFVE